MIRKRLFEGSVIAGALAAGWGVSSAPLYVLLLMIGSAVGLAMYLWPFAIFVVLGGSISLEEMGLLPVSFAGVPLTIAKLAVLGSIGVWSVRSAVRRTLPFDLTAVDIGLALVVLSMLISLSQTVDLQTSFITIVSLVLLAVLLHLVHSVVMEIEPRHVFLVMGVVAFAYLLYGVTWAPYESGRLAGTRGNPNLWATTVLTLSLPPVLGLSRDRQMSSRLLVLGIGLLLPINVFLTASRGGFLGMLAGVPFVVVAFRKYPLRLIAFLVALPILTFMLVDVDHMFERLNAVGDEDLASGDQSLESRTEALIVGWHLFVDHWFVGVGPGMFRQYFAEYTSSGVRGFSHNMYLDVAAELGTLGLLAHGVLAGLLARANWVYLRLTWGRADEAKALGIMAMFASWGVLGLFGGFYSEAQVWLYMGVLVALHARERARRPTEASAADGPGEELARAA